MAYKRPEFPPKTHPCKDEDFYREWGRRHWYCAACGRTDDLSTHHIVKQGRSHEAVNLLRLCLHPCHDLAEGLDVPDATAGGLGRPLLPKLTLGICLTLKLRADPGEVDFARLEALRGSRLPDLEPVPEFFERLFRRNRPEFGS